MTVKRSRTRWFIGLTALAAIVGLGLWCTRPAWGNALAEGFYLFEVAHTGAWLQEVDHAEVFLLGNLMQNGGAGGKSPADFIGFPVEAQATLNETEAREIAEQWRAIPRGNRYMFLCHEPLYGLRLQRGNKIVLETTVCWNCQTYDFKAFGNDPGMMEWGFDAKSRPAQALLRLLMKKVPPPAQEQAEILKDFPESNPATNP